jgi:hypothetical protein
MNEEVKLRCALDAALARYDEYVAKCPVNNPRRPFRSSDACPTCGATADSYCGRDAAASYALIQELRPLATQTPENPHG